MTFDVFDDASTQEKWGGVSPYNTGRTSVERTSFALIGQVRRLVRHNQGNRVIGPSTWPTLSTYAHLSANSITSEYREPAHFLF